METDRKKRAMKGFQQMAFYSRQETIREIQHKFESGCRLEAANRLADLENTSIQEAMMRLIEVCK